MKKNVDLRKFATDFIRSEQVTFGSYKKNSK